jgi:hypothetical protein
MTLGYDYFVIDLTINQITGGHMFTKLNSTLGIRNSLIFLTNMNKIQAVKLIEGRCAHP